MEPLGFLVCVYQNVKVKLTLPVCNGLLLSISLFLFYLLYIIFIFWLNAYLCLKKRRRNHYFCLWLHKVTARPADSGLNVKYDSATPAVLSLSYLAFCICWFVCVGLLCVD